MHRVTAARPLARPAAALACVWAAVFGLAAAPTGRYLSVVVDARTFRLLDYGLSPKPPPVSPASLAPITYLIDRRA